MRVKLSLMGDMCRPWPAMLTVHEAYPSVEMPTPIMWAPGLALQQNKVTKTVFHKSQFMALEGHDCGYCIPHIVPFPLLSKLPLIIAFSKRKVMFSSSTVKAEDNQIACSQLSGGVPLPMLSCGSPVSIPNSFPAFNHLHAVSVNLTVGDLVAGLIGIVMAVMCDGLLKTRWLGKDAKWLGEAKWLAKTAPSPFDELLGAKSILQFGVKMMFGIATNAGRVLLTGEGEFKVEVLSSYAGGKAGYEVKRDGTSRLVTQTQYLTEEGSRQDEHVHTFDKDGNRTKDENATSFANRNGASTTSTSDACGGDGETRETKYVSSRGNVSSLIGGNDGRTDVRTVSVVETHPSNGTPAYSADGFRGTSSTLGNWGTPL